MGLGTKKGKKQEGRNGRKEESGKAGIGEKMNERKQEWEMRNERKEELVKEE